MTLPARLAAALAALLLAGCATLPPPAPVRFKILQINDVYKIEGLQGGELGGFARLRSLRQQLESDGTPVLVLHGGDALYPSVMSKYLDARPIVDVMNLLDGEKGTFDPAMIVTFGNHELDNSDASILLARLQDSEFEWIATNTLHCNPSCDAPFPGVRQTIVRDLDGLRVGFLGLLLPTKRPYAATTDVEAAARGAVESLRRAGADVIIAVTHQEMEDDVNLVRSVPGIDLVIGGHDHLFMQERVGDTWITKADADAKSAVVYDITVDRSGRLRTAPLRVVLDETVAKDAEVDAAVARWLDVLARELGGNETIGRTKNLLEGVEPAVRGRETALGNLLADAAREQMQTEVAVINGGSIRINDNIPPGPITKYDIEGIFYYDNTLVAFPATGAQLLAMLRNSVSRVDAASGRFLQVSGVRFAYRASDGRYTVDAADVEVNGKPLELDRDYSIATTDFMYTRGTEDGYDLFSDATRPPKIDTARERDFRETVEDYIRTRGTVDVRVEGRIERRDARRGKLDADAER